MRTSQHQLIDTYNTRSHTYNYDLHTNFIVVQIHLPFQIHSRLEENGGQVCGWVDKSYGT